MKSRTLILLMLMSLVFSCTKSGGGSNSSREPDVNRETVFICTGKYAERYHSSSNCSGLGNCRGEIKEVYLEEAEAEDKTKCSKCY